MLNALSKKWQSHHRAMLSVPGNWKAREQWLKSKVVYPANACNWVAQGVMLWPSRALPEQFSPFPEQAPSSRPLSPSPKTDSNCEHWFHMLTVEQMPTKTTLGMSGWLAKGLTEMPPLGCPPAEDIILPQPVVVWASIAPLREERPHGIIQSLSPAPRSDFSSLNLGSYSKSIATSRLPATNAAVQRKDTLKSLILREVDQRKYPRVRDY